MTDDQEKTIRDQIEWSTERIGNILVSISQQLEAINKSLSWTNAYLKTIERFIEVSFALGIILAAVHWIFKII